jgi:regulator of sigma E protease
MQFSFLAIIFVFGLLVLIHELGHFIAAKLMGVRVERFSIGFPPRLFGKKVGDTDYCISAIPLGGYVKMSGMIDESMDTKSTGADYEFNSKPVWKRIIIITAGVVMNFLLAIFILTAVSYTQGERVFPYNEIGEVGDRGVVKRVGFIKGDKIIAVNSVSVQNVDDIMSEFIKNLNNDIIFTVQRDDQIINLHYKKEWFQEKDAEYLDLKWIPPAKVGQVLPDMPAGEIGLQKGDQIVEIAGIKILNWQNMTEVIRRHPGDTLNIRWKREGELLSASIIPAKTESKDSLGNVIFEGKIGIGPYFEHIPVTFIQAISKGFNGTIDLISLNMKGLWWVLSGIKSAQEVIGGPIMIAKLAGDAAAMGWESLWRLIAALSAILAFFNILPIPALDGGHLMFLIIEGISGKPLSTKTKLVIQQIGMAILLTLIIFILYIDIHRLLF